MSLPASVPVCVGRTLQPRDVLRTSDVGTRQGRGQWTLFLICAHTHVPRVSYLLTRNDSVNNESGYAKLCVHTHTSCIQLHIFYMSNYIMDIVHGKYAYL